MTKRFTKFPPEVVELCRQQGIRPSDIKDYRVGEEFTVVVTFQGRRACLPLDQLMLSYRNEPTNQLRSEQPLADSLSRSFAPKGDPS